jgi:hypothetical protein
MGLLHLPAMMVPPGSAQIRAKLQTVAGPSPDGLPWTLRSGGAAAMLAAGVQLADIMYMGRWASLVALRYSLPPSAVPPRVLEHLQPHQDSSDPDDDNSDD